MKAARASKKTEGREVERILTTAAKGGVGWISLQEEY